MGVSRTGKDFRELKEKYFQALNALKQYIYSDGKQIFFEDELKGQETAFSDEVCGRIINAVRAGNEDGVREQIEKFLQEYQQKRCRILPMKRQFLLLQRAIDALTEELGMDQKRNRSLGNFIRNIEENTGFFTDTGSLDNESYRNYKRSRGNCGAENEFLLYKSNFGLRAEELPARFIFGGGSQST